MIIKSLALNAFRNIDNINIEFDKGLNIIYGDNAQGKTNIIESIFLMAFGKSFRTNKDKEMIMLSKQFAKINGEYEKKDNINIYNINNYIISLIFLRIFVDIPPTQSITQ